MTHNDTATTNPSLSAVVHLLDDSTLVDVHNQLAKQAITAASTIGASRDLLTFLNNAGWIVSDEIARRPLSIALNDDGTITYLATHII